jgi:hypothetical protein
MGKKKLKRQLRRLQKRVNALEQGSAASFDALDEHVAMPPKRVRTCTICMEDERGRDDGDEALLEAVPQC